MNAETFTLPPTGYLEVECHQIKACLRILLSTIIFNRALGPVRPRELDSELFDITYVSWGVHCGPSGEGRPFA